MYNIGSGFYQIGNHVVYGTTGMMHHFQTETFGLLHQLTGTRQNELSDSFGRDHQAVLAPQVVAYQNSMQFAPGGFVKNFVGPEVKIYNFVGHGHKQFRSQHHIHQGRFHAKSGTGILKMSRPDHTHNSITLGHLVHYFAAKGGIDVFFGIGPVKFVHISRIAVIFEKTRSRQGTFVGQAVLFLGKIKSSIDGVTGGRIIRHLHGINIVVDFGFESNHVVHSKIVVQGR